MSLELTPALEERLLHFAAQSNRTPEDVAQEAIEGYVNHLEELSAAIREGEESAERDGWLTHEEVFDRLFKKMRKTA